MPAKINRLMPASRIAEKFGGLTKFANAFEPPKQLSTIQRWLESGYVPARHNPDVLEAGRRARVRIVPADFVASEEALAEQRRLVANPDAIENAA